MKNWKEKKNREKLKANVGKTQRSNKFSNDFCPKTRTREEKKHWLQSNTVNGFRFTLVTRPNHCWKEKDRKNIRKCTSGIETHWWDVTETYCTKQKRENDRSHCIWKILLPFFLRCSISNTIWLLNFISFASIRRLSEMNSRPTQIYWFSSTLVSTATSRTEEQMNRVGRTRSFSISFSTFSRLFFAFFSSYFRSELKTERKILPLKSGRAGKNSCWSRISSQSEVAMLHVDRTERKKWQIKMFNYEKFSIFKRKHHFSFSRSPRRVPFSLCRLLELALVAVVIVHFC